MDITTTRTPNGAQDNAYTLCCPRIVAAARRLVERQRPNWPPNHSNFKRLVVRECVAANNALTSMDDEAPATRVELIPSARVQVAVWTAVRSMSESLLE